MRSTMRTKISHEFKESALNQNDHRELPYALGQNSKRILHFLMLLRLNQAQNQLLLTFFQERTFQPPHNCLVAQVNKQSLRPSQHNPMSSKGNHQRLSPMVTNLLFRTGHSFPMSMKTEAPSSRGIKKTLITQQYQARTIFKSTATTIHSV